MKQRKLNELQLNYDSVGTKTTTDGSKQQRITVIFDWELMLWHGESQPLLYRLLCVQQNSCANRFAYTLRNIQSQGGIS